MLEVDLAEDVAPVVEVLLMCSNTKSSQACIFLIFFFGLKNVSTCLSPAEQRLHVLRTVQLLSEPQAICEVQGRQPIEWRPHLVEGTQQNFPTLHQTRSACNPPPEN